MALDLAGSAGWFALAILLVATALAASALAASRIVRRAQSRARAILADATQEAESRANEILVSAQEKALALEEEVEKRQLDLDGREGAIEAKGRQLETDLNQIERQRRDVERRQAALTRAEASIRESEAAATRDRQEAAELLERTAGMSQEQARAELIASVESEARRQASRLSRRIEDEARELAERDAVNLTIQATQRLGLKAIVESTVSFIELPNDEMKGRIIGREGRNIRSLEMATGIDLVVDDTPGAILISSFDPIRREVAKIAVLRLLEDGRIHPARIEEVVAKVRTEIDALTEESGVQTAFELGISELHPRLARLVGRMRFRTHHGHNLLQHSVEVALLAGHMASEVGARADVARRAGLLHEIARVEEGATGNIVLTSAELALRFGQPPDVGASIQGMHKDTEPKTVEALLLRTANRLSDSRPGARKDNLQVFIERLTRLEAIASGFPGVQQAYAVKAGKELRVLVDSKRSSDEDAHALSRAIAQAIERDLDYPGQVKVSVVRETRAVQYAV